jgi:hypothetical protein
MYKLKSTRDSKPATLKIEPNESDGKKRKSTATVRQQTHHGALDIQVQVPRVAMHDPQYPQHVSKT